VFGINQTVSDVAVKNYYCPRAPKPARCILSLRQTRNPSSWAWKGDPLLQKFFIGFVKIPQVTLVVARGGLESWTLWLATTLSILYGLP